MSELFHLLLNSSFFGVGISLITFYVASMLYRKTASPIMSPIIVSTLMIIFVLMTFHISFEEYDRGGRYISFFLGPATVVLAVPLYRQLDTLKKHLIPVVTGILMGSAAGIISILILCQLFDLDRTICISMVPKSVTTPIGIEISKQLGGLPSVTVAAIVFTGVAGILLLPTVLRIFNIRDKVAVGVAIGTSSHALGTTKAVELGETEGAMSGLAIGVAGLVTVFLAQVLVAIML